MNKYPIIVISILVIFTSCDKTKQPIKLVFETETICHFNDDYSGVDSTMFLIQDRLIKTWNKYDQRFLLINTNSNKSEVFFRDGFENKKYRFEVIDTSHYNIIKYPEEKTIYGYKCQKAKIFSVTDTLIVYYTNELEVNYSPKGQIDGFVLEYSWKNKYYNYNSTLVAVENNPTEIIVFPTDYNRTTKEKYTKRFDKNHNNIENRLPFVIEGQKAPHFMTTDINDDTIDLEQKKGKVLVFNFWFIGCRGCVYEIPDLNKIVSHFKGKKDVEFYAISSDSKNALKRFQRRKQFDFTIVPNASLINHIYGVHAFPTTLIIDKDGNIRKTYHFKVIEELGLENVINDIEKIINE